MDYPNSKKDKKVFLCLFVGSGNSSRAQLPKGLEGDEEAGDTVAFERRREGPEEEKLKEEECESYRQGVDSEKERSEFYEFMLLISS